MGTRRQIRPKKQQQCVLCILLSLALIFIDNANNSNDNNNYLFLFVQAQQPATQAKYCSNTAFSGMNAPFTVLKAITNNATELKTTVDLFRFLLGGKDNLNHIPNVTAPGSANNTSIFNTGYRLINWDDPGIPQKIPRDYFSKTRGLFLRSTKNKFRVSGNATTKNVFTRNAKGDVISNSSVTTFLEDYLFNTIHPDAWLKFQPYSRHRIFSPIENNTFSTEFNVPGKGYGVRASVRGFGAIFLDADYSNLTKITFFAKSGCILSEECVPGSPGGLSFVGGYSTATSPTEHIYRVRMTLGDKVLDSTNIVNARGTDIVVLDDLIYSEPQKV